MSEFIKFSMPDDLRVLQDETIKKISKSGKIKIGINEVTKSIERGDAKLVIIAEDVSPSEIVMHIPVISKEKKITFSYAKTKDDLGKMVGISAKASCIAILNPGSLLKELNTLIDKIEDVSSGKKVAAKEEKVKEVKKEKVSEKTKEAVKEEKPSEKPKEAVKEEKPSEKPKEEVKKTETVEEKTENKE